MSTSTTPQIDAIADTLRDMADGTFISYGWTTYHRVNGMWKNGPVEPLTSWDVALIHQRTPDMVNA